MFKITAIRLYRNARGVRSRIMARTFVNGTPIEVRTPFAVERDDFRFDTSGEPIDPRKDYDKDLYKRLTAFKHAVRCAVLSFLDDGVDPQQIDYRDLYTRTVGIYETLISDRNKLS